MLHADETGTRVGLAKAWVHTLTADRLTLLCVHERRGREALADIGVLSRFSGTLVHDGYSSYDAFADLVHAQCGSHLLRHLAALGKTPRFAPWCGDMTELQLAAGAASRAAALDGKKKVPARTAVKLKARYHEILEQAFCVLPAGPPPRLRHSGGWFSFERDAWNLAIRMRDGADDVLRLLDDTAVTLTNNAAGRSLRMRPSARVGRRPSPPSSPRPSPPRPGSRSWRSCSPGWLPRPVLPATTTAGGHVKRSGSPERGGSDARHRRSHRGRAASRRMQALLDEASVAGLSLAVPAGVLAQAWRGGPLQALLARFLRLPMVEVVPLDEQAARAAGVLCGQAGSEDVIDASVVVCALLRHDVVVTSDPDDLRRLDPHLRLAVV